MQRAEALRIRLDAVSTLLQPHGYTLEESGGAREVPRWFHIKQGARVVYESPVIGRIEAKAKRLTEQS
jgi:hypothetical protein